MTNRNSAQNEEGKLFGIQQRFQLALDHGQADAGTNVSRSLGTQHEPEAYDEWGVVRIYETFSNALIFIIP